jgi:hypothetical protein
MLRRKRIEARIGGCIRNRRLQQFGLLQHAGEPEGSEAQARSGEQFAAGVVLAEIHELVHIRIHWPRAGRSASRLRRPMRATAG